MYAENPDLYFYPDQYNNASNWRAHYDTTAPEIIEQTGGRLTHFVAGLGTSGTFVGVGRRLRRDEPAIRLISVQPDSPLHGLEGSEAHGHGHRAGDLRPDAGRRGHRREHRGGVRADAPAGAQEGLFVGISSGANLAGALRVARKTSDAVIVVVFCDGGEKYLSERFWDEGERLV